MDSEPCLKLPVVDLSGERLKDRKSWWESTCKQVVCALEEYGCFVAIYDGVPLQLQNAVFNCLEELFDLPPNTKQRNVSEIPYFGYLGNASVRPLYESLGIYHATTLQSVEDFTNLMWPNGNHHFCKTMVEYSKHVAELEKFVTRMVFDGYGVTPLYESHHESTTYLLKMNSYRVPQKDESCLGAQSHTDKNFLTVMHQNQINGLEIQTKNGHWIQFDSSLPSSYVIMAGDSLLVWSNGRIHNPFHRVVMRESKARYSLTLFSYQKDLIKVPEELVDEEHPLQFKPFDNIGFMHFVSSEVGRKQESALKAYCGL